MPLAMRRKAGALSWSEVTGSRVTLARLRVSVLILPWRRPSLAGGEGADGGHGVSPVRFVSGPPRATLMVIDQAGGALARIAQRPQQRRGRRAPTVLVREE